MRALALHQITAGDVTPPELVSIAAEVGCSAVCVFVRSPMVSVAETGPMQLLFPTVTPETRRVMKARLADCGVSIMNIEYFPIEADTDLESYRKPLELGAELGAVRAVTHVHDTDQARAVANLARLCELGAEYGLQFGLEFMGLSPGCNSLEKARRVVTQVNRPNLGIAIDALHLVRTGSTVDEVAGLDPKLVAYAQLCDGPHRRQLDDYLPEALDRLVPGQGVFPLQDLVRALPLTASMDVEVPKKDLRRQGISPLEWSRRAVDACRTLLTAAGVAG